MSPEEQQVFDERLDAIAKRLADRVARQLKQMLAPLSTRRTVHVQVGSLAIPASAPLALPAGEYVVPRAMAVRLGLAPSPDIVPTEKPEPSQETDK